MKLDQQAIDRHNDEEIQRDLDRLLEAEAERERVWAERDAELRRLHASPHRPDETDDVWTERWLEDFERAEREYDPTMEGR